jgi:hypothetical protein
MTKNSAARKATAPIKVPAVKTHGGLAVAKGAAGSTKPANIPMKTKHGLPAPKNTAARSTAGVPVTTGFKSSPAGRGTPADPQA